jgi:general secretion pathway protein M
MKWLKPIVMKLNRRERLAVLIGISFLCLFMLARFVVFPFMEKKERLRRSLAMSTQNLKDIQILKEEYQAVIAEGRQAEKRFNQRRKSFTLYAFLDKLAGEVGIKDKMTYMKPTVTPKKGTPYKISLVEMNLKGLTLEQITQYLYKIEMSNNMVTVKRLSLTKSDDKNGGLNLVLQVETIEV